MSQKTGLNSFLAKYSTELKELVWNFNIEVSKEKCINFMADQLKLNTFELHSKIYSSDTRKQALDLFLQSRNSYNCLRKTLLLRHFFLFQYVPIL